jgi:hypothetical protein
LCGFLRFCCPLRSGKLWRLPLFDFNQHQYCSIATVLFGSLVKRHYMRMLCQPERRLLLENMFTVPVHDAGAKDMFASAGGDQRPQLLLGL